MVRAAVHDHTTTARTTVHIEDSLHISTGWYRAAVRDAAHAMKRLSFVAAVALLVLPAASHVQAQAAPQEVTVNFLAQGEPDSLDPNRASLAFSGDVAVVRQLFEPLLRFDDK